MCKYGTDDITLSTDSISLSICTCYQESFLYIVGEYCQSQTLDTYTGMVNVGPPIGTLALQRRMDEASKMSEQ